MNTKNKVHCDLCYRNCFLGNGQVGFCKARANRNGKIESVSYGKVTAISLDPIEKKPLAFFYPKSLILSVGSFGCNMNCPFCQNHEIARAGEFDYKLKKISPKELVELALDTKDCGNIGIAFTYNEPLINFEYVKDTFEIARLNNLKTALVTNGQINDKYLDEILPLVDTWNIDLKAFSKEKYKILGGDLELTLNTIKRASELSHVELTTLVVPGISDNLEEFKREIDFISKVSIETPLHLTRYFPMYEYRKQKTNLSLMKDMKEIAEEKLEHVLLGNVWLKLNNYLYKKRDIPNKWNIPYYHFKFIDFLQNHRYID